MRILLQDLDSEGQPAFNVSLTLLLTPNHARHLVAFLPIGTPGWLILTKQANPRCVWRDDNTGPTAQCSRVYSQAVLRSRGSNPVYHFLIVHPRADPLSSLGLSILFCKLGVIIISASLMVRI